MEIKQIENNMVIMFRATDVVKHAKKCGFDITEAEGAELLRRMLMDTPNQDQDLITALEDAVESAFEYEADCDYLGDCDFVEYPEEWEESLQAGMFRDRGMTRYQSLQEFTTISGIKRMLKVTKWKQHEKLPKDFRQKKKKDS